MKKPNNTSKDRGVPNPYDRIFKENAEYLFIPLIELELKLKIKSFKALKEKIIRTVGEREMDFFYQIITENDQKLLLHIEFQTHDDKDMIFRMAEYHGMAFRKYKLPIEHVVIFLGTGTSKMEVILKREEIFTDYHLINIHKLNTDQLLSSQIPEVILLALLSDFEKERSETILRLILRQLKTVCKSEKELDKYLTQLIILSRLRTLEDVTTKIIRDMPINYDIEQDWLYKQGIKKGMERGMKKGVEETKKEAITELLQLKVLSLSQIADIMKVSAEYVKQIESNLKNKFH